MNAFDFPASADIYLEKSGKKVATVQSYETRHIAGEYAIKLTRVYGIDVFKDVRELEGFDLVAEKANSTIRYTDCRIKGTVEEGVIGGMILDVVYVVAREREEINHDT